jgi:hypothetical protein
MKKLFLVSLVCLIASYAWALTTITTGKIMGSPFCGGTAVNVPYTVNGAANAGNVFTAQLSDSKGNFTSPVNIGTLAATGSGTIAASIPLGTGSGTKYRIRVVSSNPVVIGSANTKNLKINPKPTGTTACAATLNWASTGTASSYKVRFKKTSDGSYGSIISLGNVLTYTFTSLKAGTSYDFQVRAVCANGQQSDWTKQSGSTLASPVPTGGTITALTVTTATLDWNDMTCATQYRIRYRFLGDVVWDFYTTSTTSTKVLTNMQPAMDYEAQISTLSGPDLDSSAYSATISWEQPYFKLAQANVASSFSVFPNPSEGSFTFQYNGTDSNTPVDITIQNMYGQVVFEAKRNYAQGLNEEQVSIPNATSGLYLIKVKSGNEVNESSMMVK